MSIRHYPPRRPKAAKNPSGWGGTRDRAEQARFRRMLIQRDGFRCWECGAAPTKADPLQAHHFTDTNGRLLCREHLNPIGWRASVMYVPDRENQSHGSSMGAKLRRLCNGTRFRYVFAQTTFALAHIHGPQLVGVVASGALLQRLTCIREKKMSEQPYLALGHGLELPANRGHRDRIESPERAGVLLAALPAAERPLWATALYAGLRIGELRALRWRCVDFDAGLLRVEHGWDDVEGEIEVKTGAGRRNVPLAGLVRRELAALKLRTGRDGDDLVFGRTASLPFVRSTVRSRARRAWAVSGMDPLTPHRGAPLRRVLPHRSGP